MKQNLSDDKRLQIVCWLLENLKDGNPRRGKLKEVASKFDVTPRTVVTIWKKANTQRQAGFAINVKSTIKGKHVRQNLVFPQEKINEFDKWDKTTQWKLAKAVGVSESTVQRWVKKGLLRGHTNSLKPDLTIDNKYLRLNFIISQLVYNTTMKKLQFRDMGDMVHIDEKWFYMCKSSQRFYLLPDEVEPHRTCKNKRYIVKVMFMVAVVRPRYNEDGECTFDGKLGIWPFTYEEPAKRNSKNRASGIMETKPTQSVNKQAIKHMLLSNVIPTIKQNWPQNASKSIIIQQDNAKPHLSGDDGDFIAAATSDGFNISLIQQPANGPDLNILDLGFLDQFHHYS